ncbi:hypothetical protein EON81_01960 [bacterium]|nr:MAG: hypothetical protein EON81_01960 [bacterium]
MKRIPGPPKISLDGSLARAFSRSGAANGARLLEAHLYVQTRSVADPEPATFYFIRSRDLESDFGGEYWSYVDAQSGDLLKELRPGGGTRRSASIRLPFGWNTEVSVGKAKGFVRHIGYTSDPPKGKRVSVVAGKLYLPAWFDPETGRLSVRAFGRTSVGKVDRDFLANLSL